MMDNGYPQTTDVKLLKDFIQTESYELKDPFAKFMKAGGLMKSGVKASFEGNRWTNVVSWRGEGIKYSKN